MTKILVIEDEKTVRSNIVDLLEAEGYKTISAENGLIGLQMAFAQNPDLIICDIMMPKMGGYEVLTHLRQNNATIITPFIFLTAQSGRNDLRQGMNLGADDYLTKPFTRSELLQTVSSRIKRQAMVLQRYSIELKQAEDKLKYHLYYDSLTGLPNRLALREQFDDVINRSNEQKPALLCVDLNRFRRINESLGWTVGDTLLKLAAERLKETTANSGFVARLQADQFVIILAQGEQKEAIEKIAGAILEHLSQPFTLEGQPVFVEANIGIACYPDNGRDIDNLVKNASTATAFAAKQTGYNYQFFSNSMTSRISDRLAMEASLHYAIEHSEFVLYYQPQVDSQSWQIIGAEALVRWQHPERGLVPPNEFIPLAEETGLIVPLGDWILHEACVQAANWQKNGFDLARIAVNISARQFEQGNLDQKVIEILRATKLDPKRLELEITESVIVSNPENASAMLKRLKDLGIQVAIDDFGTGYSSLGYLQQFPFDTLKIDRSFVRNVAESGYAAITTAIIQMARSLGLRMVAEGVETEAEVAFLERQHCDTLQGYFFSRPLPLADFLKLLSTNQPRMAHTVAN